MKKLAFIFLLAIFAKTYGQEELNNYKYVIVPKQFDAFKEQNQYQTSTLVKYLLSEKGFNVVYDDQLPGDLSSNRCIGLTASILDNSNMFTTKASVVFKDCNSKEIFTTAEGTSKEKEYKLSYGEALKKSFNSLSGYNYSYNEKASEPITVSFKNDVKTLKNTKAVEEVAVEQEETASADVKVIEPAAVKVENKKTVTNVYYAQDIDNGYQLVDSTPKIVMKMFKTSQQNIFLGEEENGNSGLLYNKNGEWYFEYYSEGKLVVQTLNIKF